MFQDERDAFEHVGRQVEHDLENVHFELEVDGVDGRLGVRRVSLQEGLSQAYSGLVEALHDGDPPKPDTLLGRTFTLRVDRSGLQRTMRGIIRHAAVAHPPEGAVLALRVAPSIWRLTLGLDTRTYLDLTIPELVSKVVEERLGSAVEVDTSRLTHTYERHEFLLQYQESPWDFVNRWMEQEGIFFYEADGESTERIVLADSMKNLPYVTAGPSGSTPYWSGETAEPPEESIFDLHHDRELGTTQVALGDYDWTHPAVAVRASRPASSPLDPAPEIFDHANVVSFHRYDGNRYAHNSVERAAQVRSEAQALAHRRWSARGTLVSAAPGRVVRVEGVPEADDLDGSYLIVGTGSVGTATEGQAGQWSSHYALVPTTSTYRPPRRTPRPVVPGPETARVVGPSGQEIETDEHGRVKVRFHWDRQRERTEEGGSPWIRVSQSWAGPGFGTFFVPRIGMEVVVSFLGGDPERPLITGCVYNGENHARVNLPNDKTQSVIRTKSSLNSDGFNELRFEDATGNELVYVHAQRDYKKEVLHDRTVDVGNDESVHVHHDRRAEVDGKEHVEVHGRRRKIQHATEHETFRSRLVTDHLGSRRKTHAKNTTYHERIRGKHEVVYTGESGGVAHEVKYETGDGVVTELHDATSSLTKIEGTGAFQVRSADLSVLLSLLADQGLAGMKATRRVGMKMTDGTSRVEVLPCRVEIETVVLDIDVSAEINLRVGDNGITISPAGVLIRSGATTVDVSPAGVTVNGPTTTVLGGAFSVLSGAVTRGGNPDWT